MATYNYYILTSLPALEENEKPPVTPLELLEKVQQSGGPAELISAIILQDDLTKMYALKSGEIEEAEFAVLTDEQAGEEEALPEYLEIQQDDKRKAPEDTLWQRYFEFADETAERFRSSFTKKWLKFEISLRNGLTEARAKKLKYDTSDYLLCKDLFYDSDDVKSIVDEWSAAPNPLAGFEVLEKARWQWLNENDNWFTFSDNELAAYTAKLLLLDRKSRLSRSSE